MRNHRQAGTITGCLAATAIFSGVKNVTHRCHRPSFRIRRRVAEHVEEQRRDEFGGFLLGLPPQANDALGTGKQVDDAALLGEWWQGNANQISKPLFNAVGTKSEWEIDILENAVWSPNKTKGNTPWY